MKAIATTLLTALLATNISAWAGDQKPKVYINQHLGFNVPGYKYTQSEMPCSIDKKLVEYLINDGKHSSLSMESVSTADKIRNGVIPVLAMDIEQLVLSKDFRFGDQGDHPLPKVQVTAAIIKGDKMETAKHTCAIATLNEFTPASNVLDLGTAVTVCSATHKCLKDLSKDIIEWVAPQVK